MKLTQLMVMVKSRRVGVTSLMRSIARESESSSAVRTLKGLGYTYHGGVQWKPPLGRRLEPPKWPLLGFRVEGDTVVAKVSGGNLNARWVCGEMVNFFFPRTVVPKQAQPGPSGCACRWDANDNRIATCTRHQGWIDVVSKWAERAKAAEAQLDDSGKRDTVQQLELERKESVILALQAEIEVLTAERELYASSMDRMKQSLEPLTQQLAERNAEVAHVQMDAMNFKAERDALQAQLAAAQGQEPMLWKYTCLKTKKSEFSSFKLAYSPHGFIETPLYAAPTAQQAQPERAPLKTRAEECRGYALLGTGQYWINHTAAFDSELGAELVITLATDEDKSGNWQVGESRDNPEDLPPIQPEEMVVRIGFLSERGLFALEEQLACIRKLHFTDAAIKQGGQG